MYGTYKYFLIQWICGPTQAIASSYLRFLDHIQRLTTFGRTPLDEWSARRTDPHLTTHNTQTSMPPVGFEPTISADKRPQNYALNHMATGIEIYIYIYIYISIFVCVCFNIISLPAEMTIKWTHSIKFRNQSLRATHLYLLRVTFFTQRWHSYFITRKILWTVPVMKLLNVTTPLSRQK